MKIFTYGTLMPGERNGHLIPSELIQTVHDGFIMCEKFLYNKHGNWPLAVLSNEENKNTFKVYGKLLYTKELAQNVQERLIYNLDSYEGAPDLFQRREIKVKNTDLNKIEERVSCYFINKNVIKQLGDLEVITSGDFRLVKV